MVPSRAYCGAAPLPGELLGRFNLDPALLLVLAIVTAAHLTLAPRSRRAWTLGGWAVTGAALVSPLCALSVSLFSARVVQHMVLILIAAPMIAAALPEARPTRASLTVTGVSFAAALWLWHMPRPYDATLSSTSLYWSMHLTLFAAAVALWRELLAGRDEAALPVLVAGSAAAVQMGLLAAVLTLASRPLFAAHLFTAPAWGLTPLADQQLGGLVMWVPGGLLFLVLALRSAALLLRPAQGTISAGSA